MGSGLSKYEGDKPKNLVIVGAGFAGMAVASGLTKDPAFAGSITVVDPKESLHYNLAFLRAAVDPRWAPLALPPRSVPGITHHRALVTSVSDTAVTCDDGTELPYDALVFATGSDYNSPGKLPMSVRTNEETTAYLTRISELVKKANKITVIGGGSVGCELVGELTQVAGKKDVTLIHSGPHLFHTARGLKPKVWEKTQALMEGAGVRVIFNERVAGKPPAAAGGTGGDAERKEADDAGEAKAAEGDADLLAAGIQVGPVTLTTDKGTEVESDLVFWCGGIRARSDTYKAFLGADGVDARGRAIVDGWFRCTAKAAAGNVFALGDCHVGPVAEDAKYANAINQSKHLVKTLSNLARGKTSEKELGKAYSVGNWEMFVAPFGPKDGLGQLPNGFVVGALGKLKGGDFFYAKNWKELGNKTIPAKPK